MLVCLKHRRISSDATTGEGASQSKPREPSLFPGVFFLKPGGHHTCSKRNYVMRTKQSATNGAPSPTRRKDGRTRTERAFHRNYDANAPDHGANSGHLQASPPDTS